MHETAFRAEIRAHLGAPALFLNGEPDPAIGYLTFHPESRGRFEDFARSGVRLVAVNTTCNAHTYGTARTVSVGPGRFDYSHLDRRMASILKRHPDAVLLPRVYVGSPSWWDISHRDELLRYHDGSCTRPFFSGAHKGSVPSFSSAAWRAYARDSLARLIDHIQASEYGRRVIGYQLMGGETEEWFYHGTYEGFLSDYSPAHREAFRRFCARRRPWWRRRRSVDVPAPERRGGDGVSTLIDPRTYGDVAEYILFRSHEVADTILDLASVVKERSNGRALCGAFYGYVLELASHPFGLQHSGHLAFQRVARSPAIDFLSSPTSYINRGAGTGYSAFMCMTDSLRLHGKLWFNENDSRTHRTPPQYGCFRATTPVETGAIMRREFAHSMARGAGLWWFDMRGGWYRDRANLCEVERLGRMGRKLVGRGRRSVAEVAVLVQSEALRYLKLRNPIQTHLLGAELQHLGRMGAPFDTYDLSDLEAIPDYRAYIVLSALAPSRRERRALARLARAGGGKTFIWIYASGVITEKGIDPAGLEDLVEMEMDSLDDVAAHVDVFPGEDPRLGRIRNPLSYGTHDPARPLFVPRCDGQSVRALGFLHETDRPALAIREEGGRCSIFSAAPLVPARVLRSLLEPSGIHFYLDEHDVVYANESFVAVHGDEAGERRIRLPARRRIRDVDTDRVVDGNEITVDLAERDTRLFLLEDPV